MGTLKNIISRIVNAVTTPLLQHNDEFQHLKTIAQQLEIVVERSSVHPQASLYKPCRISDSSIGRYSYMSGGGKLSMVHIGQFCSIGPNLLAGHGIHPTNGISTSPLFYSTEKQNRTTLSATNKIAERKPITIGNDVFIGANVTILDGITIGDGAVIGAGAVVSKNIPPYAIAVGVPIQIIKYRFDEPTIQKLLSSEWWNWPEEKLPLIESRFFDIESFLSNLPN